MEQPGNILPTDMQKLLIDSQMPKKYKKNDIIYEQGAEAYALYFVVKGQAKIYINSADGAERTLAIATEGSILGEAAFFLNVERISSAKAIVASEIIAVDRRNLLSLIQATPKLALTLLNVQADRIQTLSAEVDSMTFLQADCRIARLLLNAKIKKPIGFIVELTHEEIGSIVGVSRVTVSKTLNCFANNGLIQTSYRRITIKNEVALKNIAQFENKYS
ncbi:MAG: Crp/Fnr family transcriptional regulator [Bacillota bacterium]|nr:Crp/Fnr family transcriptional regulator [Bacillota bacterium]